MLLSDDASDEAHCDEVATIPAKMNLGQYTTYNTVEFSSLGRFNNWVKKNLRLYLGKLYIKPHQYLWCSGMFLNN
jgi:hypothetical protein